MLGGWGGSGVGSRGGSSYGSSSGFPGAGEQTVCFSWFGSSSFLCEECVRRGGGVGYGYGLKMETLSPKPYYVFCIRDDHFYFRGSASGYGVAVWTWVGGVRVSWMICQDCFLELGLWGWGLTVAWMIFRDGFLGLGVGGDAWLENRNGHCLLFLQFL